MDENELLLLGLLITHSQHGYQLNEFIERGLGHVTNMKKGNAYATLGRLAKEGYINLEITQEGNRPQRKVYSITPNGETRFYELLRNNLAHSERMVFAIDVGLMFIERLPREEAIACLTDRLALLKKKLAEQHAGLGQEAVPGESSDYRAGLEHGFGVNLALQHVLYMQRAELSWLEATLEELRRA
jgi:DNA-binding PadR family transcriptional regulator